MPKYPYVSRQLPLPWGDETAYVVGYSPWVQLLFHPNRAIHEHADFMVQLDAKYNRRYQFKWWSPRIPPVPWTMVFRQRVTPRRRDRVLGWLLTLYVIWRAL